jgi:hypothetical protein
MNEFKEYILPYNDQDLDEYFHSLDSIMGDDEEFEFFDDESESTESETSIPLDDDEMWMNSDYDSDDDDNGSGAMTIPLAENTERSEDTNEKHGEDIKYCFPLHSSIDDIADSIVDSGCSQTSVNNKKLFKFFRKRNQIVNTVGPAINVEVSGPIGPFKDVFLIPILSHNLVSVKDLNDLGVRVTFEENDLIMEYKDCIIMKITTKTEVWMCNFITLCDSILAVMDSQEISKCWWLDTKVALVSTRSKQREISESKDVNIAAEPDVELVDDNMKRSEFRSSLIRTWHNRLGHRSESLIVKEVNDGKLNIGIEKLSKKDLPINKCVCCMRAKSHKIPRYARPVARATMTIEKRVSNPAYNPSDDKQQGFGPGIVSTDSCGPYTVPSLLDSFVGNQNFMLMDSKAVFTYGYVKKDGPTMIKNLKHLLDVEMRRLNLGVVRYHSDGAKELSGTDITNFLAEKGIQKTTSTPYSAQENSYIERHFGMEVESSVAMMMHARYLPKALWFLAKQFYTFVYNLLPTQTARGRMSPSEYLHGVVPDISYLRTFGSKAWVNIPLSKRMKDFKSRALSGYLVGYSATHNGAYKIWIPEYNRIIVSRDVKFDENIPQGDIDFKKDTYWLEIREFGHRLTGEPRNILDFQYLVDEIFYDPEMESHYKVLNIVVNRGNIVAGYAKYRPGEDIQNNNEVGQMHVANIEQLMSPIDEEEVNSLQCNITDRSLEEKIDASDTEIFPSREQCMSDDGEEHARTLAEPHSFILGTTTADERQNNPFLFRGIDIDKIIDLPESGREDNTLCYAYVTTFVNEVNVIEPQTYHEAIQGRDKKEWLLAIANELDSLREKGVLELIPLTGMNRSGKRIGSRFIFKIKMKHGIVDKYKCRLVAKGFTQRANIDYSETFSPVARMNTLRIFLKLSIDCRHHRISIDFKTAFLNATINEELYLDPIEGMNCPPGFTYRLKKAIYGLKQAGRSWSVILTEFIVMQGLHQCVSEPCVFKGINIMVIVYVDDVIISTLKRETGEILIREIEKLFEIGDIGPVDWYLGISFDDKGDSIRMSQKDYVDKMLLKYHVDTDHEEDTPMSDKLKLIKDSGDELFPEFDLKGKVGSLMYLSVCTRPDICYAVSAIARMSNHPSESVCIAVNHLFAYLNKNRDMGLMFERQDTSEVIAWSDSDYAGDLNDYKSTSGIAVFFGLLIICWYCSKQPTTAQSSTDAEAISMNFATKEVVWIRGFLKELGVDLSLPTRMKGDNVAAIMLSKNPMFHKRTKHIMVKISYLQEMVKESITIWEYIETNLNIADMFTKALHRVKFLEMRKKLMLDGPK